MVLLLIVQTMRGLRAHQVVRGALLAVLPCVGFMYWCLRGLSAHLGVLCTISRRSGRVAADVRGSRIKPFWVLGTSVPVQSYALDLLSLVLGTSVQQLVLGTSVQQERVQRSALHIAGFL